MASNESNYLMQVAAGPSNDFLNVKYAESMDLSEMHLAWYTFMSPERRQNFSVVNRKTRMLEEYPSAFQALKNGGWNVEAAAVLARGWGWGPIQEKDGLKYSDFTNVANIETLAKNIAKSPDVYPSSLRLIEASFMVTRFDSDGNLLFSTEANRNRVKNMVMTKGAASAIYNMADDRRFFNRETGAYFYSVNEKSLVSRDNPANITNHAVVIVG